MVILVHAVPVQISAVRLGLMVGHRLTTRAWAVITVVLFVIAMEGTYHPLGGPICKGVRERTHKPCGKI